MTEIKGFTVLPFTLPSVGKLAKSATHYIYIKKHTSKSAEEQHSLFVVNLPLLTNLPSLKQNFSKILKGSAIVSDLMYDEFGLHDIDLNALTSELAGEDPVSTRKFPRNTGLVQFVDEDACNNAMKLLKKYANGKERVEWEFNQPTLATFLSFYQPLDTEYVKESVHYSIEDFNEREQESIMKLQEMSKVDEDGFTLVVGKNTKTHGGIMKKLKNPLLKHTKVTKINKTLEKKQKEDFYRFQIRERKKQEINQLLSKFKDDQERIKEMKSKRKFDPYKKEN